MAACTNEATQISGSLGGYYLDLTSSEMDANTVYIEINTSTTDAKPSIVSIATIVLSEAVLGVNVVSVAAGAVTSIQSGLATASALSTVDTVVDAIQAKTDNLPADPAATSDIPTAVQNADTLLNRNIDQTGNGSHTVEESLAFLRNKWGVSAGTLTVYESDGTTPLWTGTVPSDPNAQPIIGMIPT